MKTFDPLSIARANVLAMQPYTSARSEYKGTAAIYLDANENSMADIVLPSRYPDPLQLKLKQAVCSIKNIPDDQIFLGNGSDEAIDLLIRIFCRPGKDSILVCPPTYGMYGVSAAFNDIAVQEVPLTASFQPDKTAILDAVKETTKIIFFCTPNNPTGNCIEATVITDICNRFNGLVVVDEAYIDFASTPSLVSQLDLCPNMVILQTFSKAYGMAGLRIGMAFASPAIISLMNKTKPPYNISSVAQELALKALSQQDRTAAWIREIITQRDILAKQLADLPFVKKVYPSSANFLLVRFHHAAAIYQYLLQRGIVVRRRDAMPGCTDCLRITTGTEAENQQLYQALKLFNQ